MTWFITAFIIASAIFMFAPKTLAAPIADNAKIQPSQWLLFTLPLLALIILMIALALGYTSSHASIAIGFALTGCSVAISRFHRFILPCAAYTGLSLVMLALQYL
ncbi:hypothetical protein L2712_03225 [Shewanella marisflavi]|uniref:hypothetical protein n=1 Tax=Shewanella marisflavi TaxID=260364 RepID=UPI00200E7CEA|nr:hypothetical protein [Shewanella marisflavi]MCL1040668.1 hypothetical protein [Shewanella marisflavi]